jgi:predicted nucleic acid-binding protein
LTLLIDEARGRKTAAELGLVTMGTLGVLGRAKQAGMVRRVRPVVARLVSEIRFFVSADIVEEFLTRIGEPPGEGEQSLAK